jgi:hypothetical protein
LTSSRFFGRKGGCGRGGKERLHKPVVESGPNAFQNIIRHLGGPILLGHICHLFFNLLEGSVSAFPYPTQANKLKLRTGTLVSRYTDCTFRSSVFSRCNKFFFLIFRTSKSPPGPNHPPNQCVLGVFRLVYSCWGVTADLLLFPYTPSRCC